MKVRREWRHPTRARSAKQGQTGVVVSAYDRARLFFANCVGMQPASAKLGYAAVPIVPSS